MRSENYVTNVLIGIVIGLITSFFGSMGSFVLWVHFDLDSRWEARKEHNRLRDIQRGRDLENEYRMKKGLPPL
jgi:hypothetical protein